MAQLRYAARLMASPGIRVHLLIDSLAVGGAEALSAEFAAVAQSAGISLSVGYLKVGPGGIPLAERLRAHGVEPAFVDVGSLGPGSTLKVRKHLAAVRPELVHTHMGASDFHGGLAARSLGIPVVSTVHAMRWAKRGREGIKERLMAAVRRRCDDRIVAVSEFARERYVAEWRERPEHVVVVRNGVRGIAAHGDGARVREELGFAPDDLVVSLVAGLRPEKAHDVAAEAIAQVRRTRPNVRLLVAGEGPMLEQVERAVGALGDGGVLAGHRDDVMAVLDATDVLLHAPHYDALPTSLIEAAAAGVPVLATRVGGIPEIVVDGETGVLVDPPPDAAALAAALEGLLADPGRRARMGTAARERFEAEFSAPAWAARLRALYDDVLANEPPNVEEHPL